ncbi:WD domain, G-beta repeat-containing protein, partial [Cardiosporidium cionae]
SCHRTREGQTQVLHRKLSLITEQPSGNRSTCVMCSKGKSFYALHQQRQRFGNTEENRYPLLYNHSLLRRLEPYVKLEGHTQCVNRLAWHDNQRFLASGSDDRRVLIWDCSSDSQDPIHSISTGHSFHIFGVGFLGDTHIVSGSVDKHVRLSSITDPFSRSVYACHKERVKHIATIPRDANFLWWSASEDGTIRQFDKRAKHRCIPSNCNNVLVNTIRHRQSEWPDRFIYSGYSAYVQNLSRDNPENFVYRRIYSEVEATRSHNQFHQLNAIAINPIQPEYIACAAGDPLVRVYDRRMLNLRQQFSSISSREGCPSHVFFPHHLWGDPFENGGEKASNPSLFWSPDGRALAATYSGEQVYVFPFNANQSIVHCQKPRFNLTPLPSLDLLTVTSLPHFASNVPPNQQKTAEVSKDEGDIVLAIHRIANDRAYGHRYTEAIAYYTMALQVAYTSTQRVHLLCNRAYSLIKRNLRGDALAAERDALEASYLDPSNYKPLFRRIQATQRSRRKIKACRLARAAMKAFPDVAEFKTMYNTTSKHV